MLTPVCNTAARLWYFVGEDSVRFNYKYETRGCVALRSASFIKIFFPSAAKVSLLNGSQDFLRKSFISEHALCVHDVRPSVCSLKGVKMREMA